MTNYQRYLKSDWVTFLSNIYKSLSFREGDSNIVGFLKNSLPEKLSLFNFHRKELETEARCKYSGGPTCDNYNDYDSY